jgi:5-formyltetrahydrofolate cyclo-ligase
VTKAELRREMRTRLAALGSTRAGKSRAIVAAIAACPSMSSRRRIALFSPLPSEPDIEGLWQLKPSQFCYPRITKGELEFVDVSALADLTISPWHPQIREHGHSEARVVPPAEIEGILVPGLAFTRQGHRLGRGGGNYDRYLVLLPPTTLKVGVCFGVQLVGSVPTEPHDVRVDAVVTEDGVLG